MNLQLPRSDNGDTQRYQLLKSTSTISKEIQNQEEIFQAGIRK
jgi:hypothetical protein